MGKCINKMGFNEGAIKNYAHFDHRVSYEKVKTLVEDPMFVASHGFLPLISKTVRNRKFDGSTSKEKTRDVAYASHLDRCIYQRYAYLLNERYNSFAQTRNLNGVALAYRNNLGKCNIDFALSAFSAMADQGHCWILVSDFRDFFPSLDHSILKNRLRLLFPNRTMPADHYRVFKSVIHCSEWDIEDLLRRNGLKTSSAKDLKALNKQDLALDRDSFRKHVKECAIQKWRTGHRGIPQGLALSGVLANIYMMNFDDAMRSLSGQTGSRYMRYSDDVIVIAPTKEALTECIAKLAGLCAEHKLEIADEKTRCYELKDGTIYDYDTIAAQARFDRATSVQYLGFDFDGTNARIRQRTIGRYYAKMHRAIKRTFSESNWPSKKRVVRFYTQYSNKGRRISRGNFITYARRAEQACRRAGLQSNIGQDVDGHYLKIRREIDFIRAMSEHD